MEAEDTGAGRLAAVLLVAVAVPVAVGVAVPVVSVAVPLPVALAVARPGAGRAPARAGDRGGGRRRAPVRAASCFLALALAGFAGLGRLGGLGGLAASAAWWLRAASAGLGLGRARIGRRDERGGVRAAVPVSTAAGGARDGCGPRAEAGPPAACGAAARLGAPAGALALRGAAVRRGSGGAPPGRARHAGARGRRRVAARRAATDRRAARRRSLRDDAWRPLTWPCETVVEPHDRVGLRRGVVVPGRAAAATRVRTARATQRRRPLRTGTAREGRHDSLMWWRILWPRQGAAARIMRSWGNVMRRSRRNTAVRGSGFRKLGVFARPRQAAGP